MPFIAVKRIMAIKAETTRGTAISVAAADFDMRLRDITIDTEIESYDRPFASGSHSRASAVMGKKKATVTCKYDMALGASVAVSPKARKLFIASGAEEIVTPSTSVLYRPNAGNDDVTGVTYTIKVMEIASSGNCIIRTVKGAMCNIVLEGELGQPLVANCTFVGAYVGDADGAAIAITSPDTSVPPSIIGATITVATIPQKISKFSLDFGNQVELEMDPADSTGYLAAYISGRQPKLTIDPQASLLATDPVYTRWAAGTESAFSMTTATSSSMKWTVSATKAQLITNKPADRNGAIIYQQEYQLHESGGYDEWGILQSA